MQHETSFDPAEKANQAWAIETEQKIRNGSVDGWRILYELKQAIADQSRELDALVIMLRAKANDAEWSTWGDEFKEILAKPEAKLREHGEREALLVASIEELLASAHPHPVEHPTMTEAWANARAALAGSDAALRAVKAEARKGAVKEALRDLIDDGTYELDANAREWIGLKLAAVDDLPWDEE